MGCATEVRQRRRQAVKARPAGLIKLARGLQLHQNITGICFANGGEMSALDKGVRSQASGSAADAFFYLFCWSY
ncbi:hypothetical protein C2E15_09455 [Mixta gaviniae]|uniref:Uncharacterized protein n=1 Tax=Mixta gaviniae TaxID=665914 RepID=A0A2L0IFC1_9GAMM|nr:hypothetical protein C2E15_09455 [Mixta gaviniae]